MKILEEVADLLSERNKILHGIWDIPEGNEIFRYILKRGAFEPISESVKLEDLENLERKIIDLDIRLLKAADPFDLPVPESWQEK